MFVFCWKSLKIKFYTELNMVPYKSIEEQLKYQRLLDEVKKELGEFETLVANGDWEKPSSPSSSYACNLSETVPIKFHPKNDK